MSGNAFKSLAPATRSVLAFVSDDGDANGEQNGGPDVRPLILGYVCPMGDGAQQTRWTHRLKAWADAEGWALPDVLGDPDPSVPPAQRSGLVALLDRLQRTGAAVVVPSRDDLDGEDDNWPELRTVLGTAARGLYILPETDQAT